MLGVYSKGSYALNETLLMPYSACCSVCQILNCYVRYACAIQTTLMSTDLDWRTSICEEVWKFVLRDLAQWS